MMNILDLIYWEQTSSNFKRGYINNPKKNCWYRVVWETSINQFNLFIVDHETKQSKMKQINSITEMKEFFNTQYV